MRTLSLHLVNFNDNKFLGDGPSGAVTITGAGGYDLSRYLKLVIDNLDTMSCAVQVDSETTQPVTATGVILFTDVTVDTKYVRIGPKQFTCGAAADYAVGLSPTNAATAIAALINAHALLSQFVVAVPNVIDTGATQAGAILIRSKLPGYMGNIVGLWTDETNATIELGAGTGANQTGLTGGLGFLGSNTVNYGLPFYAETFACSGASGAYTLTNVPVAIISSCKPGMHVTGTNVAAANYITTVDADSRTLTLAVAHAGAVTSATINNARIFGVT